MTFHYIEFKAYCQATEDPDKVIEAIVNFAGENIELEKEDAEGYYGNPIEIIEGKVSRNSEMDRVFRKLPSTVIKTLLNSIDRRMDERCNFFFRLDKQEAYQENFVLSEGSNTIKCRARVESYPAKREKAIEHIEEYLENILD